MSGDFNCTGLSRLFHLQSILNYLERMEREHFPPTKTTSSEFMSGPLQGQPVFVAQARTGGGSEYLVGIFATEPAAWSAAQRELDQGRKVWVEKALIG